MARHAIPRVLNDHLILPDRADQSFPAIQVGSEAWNAWLNEPETHSFALHSPQGQYISNKGPSRFVILSGAKDLCPARDPSLRSG